MSDRELIAMTAKLDQMTMDVAEQLIQMNERGHAKLNRRWASIIEETSGPRSVDLLIIKLAIIGRAKVNEIIESQIKDAKGDTH